MDVKNHPVECDRVIGTGKFDSILLFAQRSQGAGAVVSMINGRPAIIADVPTAIDRSAQMLPNPYCHVSAPGDVDIDCVCL